MKAAAPANRRKRAWSESDDEDQVGPQQTEPGEITESFANQDQEGAINGDDE